MWNIRWSLARTFKDWSWQQTIDWIVITGLSFVFIYILASWLMPDVDPTAVVRGEVLAVISLAGAVLIAFLGKFTVNLIKAPIALELEKQQKENNLLQNELDNQTSKNPATLEEVKNAGKFQEKATRLEIELATAISERDEITEQWQACVIGTQEYKQQTDIYIYGRMVQMLLLCTKDSRHPLGMEDRVTENVLEGIIESLENTDFEDEELPVHMRVPITIWKEKKSNIYYIYMAKDGRQKGHLIHSVTIESYELRRLLDNYLDPAKIKVKSSTPMSY